LGSSSRFVDEWTHCIPCQGKTDTVFYVIIDVLHKIIIIFSLELEQNMYCVLCFFKYLNKYFNAVLSLLAERLIAGLIRKLKH
jgi:hypothetical protein